MQIIHNSLLQVSVDENNASLNNISSDGDQGDFLIQDSVQEKTELTFPKAAAEDNLAASPWTVVDKGDSQVSLVLIDDEKSYKKFPYHFQIMATYILEGTQIKIEFAICNNSKKEMPANLSYIIHLNLPELSVAPHKIVLDNNGKNLTFESSNFELTKENEKILCRIPELMVAAESKQVLGLTITL